VPEDRGVNRIRNADENFVGFALRELHQRARCCERLATVAEEVKEQEECIEEFDKPPTRSRQQLRDTLAGVIGHSLELTAKVGLLLNHPSAGPSQGIRATCSRH